MNDLNEEQINEFFKSHNFPLLRKSNPYDENTKGVWSWGGHSYELFPQKNTLAFSKQFVSSRTLDGLPGYVAVVSSAEEQDVVVNMMGRFGVGSIWIDASDEETEGEWKWLSGELANQHFPAAAGEGEEAKPFTSWNQGEPNNAGEEDCLVLVKGATWENTPLNGWNDVSCSDEMSALLIEYGTLPHDTSPFAEPASALPDKEEGRKEEL